LPLADSSIDYIVSIHALPELEYEALVPALAELRRVLKPNGTLRLGLPDVDKAIDAYRRGDGEFFAVPDEDATSVGAKFAIQAMWYGYARSMFTYEFIEELLARSAFVRVTRCEFGQTASRFRGIVELDNRRDESMFVEATK